MKLNKFTIVALLVLFPVVWTSCSTTSEVADSVDSSKSVTVGPEWYSAGESDFLRGQNGFRAYATALAGDSSQATAKAVTQARMELKSGISYRLEQVRKKAARELAAESGLGTSGFLATLRQAENEIPDAAQIANAAAEASGPEGGYRGFAEVTVSKQALHEALDAAMSRYKTAWNAMKTSQAFKEF